MSLKAIDFMEFLEKPGPESIGAFVVKHDDSVRLCEHCKGHGIIPKQLWEMSGASNSLFSPLFLPDNSSSTSGKEPTP